MDSSETWFKIVLATGTGLIAKFLDAYAIIFIFVAVAIVMDVITGLIKCRVTGESLSSKKGYIGFWKKIALIVSFFFGIFMDSFIPVILEYVKIDLPFQLPFAMIIGCYIVLNESISIVENILATNSLALPKWVKNFLKESKKKIDDDGEKLVKDIKDKEKKEEEEEEKKDD